MPETTSPNGSVLKLAEAFRGVMIEAIIPIQEDMKALTDEMGKLEESLNGKIDKLDKKIDDRTNTTDENMQAQFAIVRKDIADLAKGEKA